MRKNRNFMIGIVCVFLALGLLAGSFLFVDWYQNRPAFTDKNGWTHNVGETEYTSDPYLSLNYVVIDSNKADFENITARQFLSKLNPVFKAYSDKTYVTFDFGDGTGLYWPYASKKYDGIYGTIDEDGHITAQQTFIHIEGKEVTSEEASVETSENSVDMYELLPEAYYTDNTMVAVMDNVLYLNIYFDTSVRSYDDIANELWNIYKKADLSDIGIVLIRMNNDTFYEVNTMIDNSVPVYIENGYEKWESFLYGENASTGSDVIHATEYSPEDDPAWNGTLDESEAITTESTTED